MPGENAGHGSNPLAHVEGKAFSLIAGEPQSAPRALADTYGTTHALGEHYSDPRRQQAKITPDHPSPIQEP
jgi:hypothetical protein